MTSTRRQFSATLLGAAGLGTGLGLWSTPEAQAQANFVEGQQYARVSPPQPVQAPTGKVEVIEFFWYGCPHCFQFEPLLDTWLKRLPPDVAFRRVPAAFREVPFVAHQRIYYSLEALGLVEQLHKRVFNAIHVERQRLDNPDEIAAFMQKEGVDKAKFLDVYNSFSVQTKQRQAKALAEAYRIDGVPAMGVNGQYYTSGARTGGLEQMLATVDYLVQRSRKT